MFEKQADKHPTLTGSDRAYLVYLDEDIDLKVALGIKNASCCASERHIRAASQQSAAVIAELSSRLSGCSLEKKTVSKQTKQTSPIECGKLNVGPQVCKGLRRP